MAEIELINVSKSWGNFNAVIDFNLIIKDKELLNLDLGPNYFFSLPDIDAIYPSFHSKTYHRS